MFPYADHDSAGALFLSTGRCVAVALPDSVLRRHDRWDGKTVVVEGVALKRFETPPNVSSVEYRGRWMAPSVCQGSKFVLYANRLGGSR
jgi:hypothetical protein